MTDWRLWIALTLLPGCAPEAPSTAAPTDADGTPGEDTDDEESDTFRNREKRCRGFTLVFGRIESERSYSSIWFCRFHESSKLATCW